MAGVIRFGVRLGLLGGGLGLLDEVIGFEIGVFVGLSVGRRLGEFHQIAVAQNRREVHPCLVGQVEGTQGAENLVGGHLHGPHLPAAGDVAAQDVGKARIILLVAVVLPQLAVVEFFERLDGLDVGRQGRSRGEEPA